MLKQLKSKSGMAMVYVLMIVVVVTVVAVTIWTVSSNNEGSVERDKSNAQAYLYAKSGVEIAVGYIMDGIADFNSEGGSQTFYGTLGNSLFTTTPPYDADGKKLYNVMFTITSTTEGTEDKFVIASTGYASIAGTDSYSDSGGTGSEATADALGFEITQEALEQSTEGAETIDVNESTPPVISSNLACNYAVFVEKEIDLDSGSPTVYGAIGTNTGLVSMNYSSNVYSLDNKNGTIYLGPTASITKPTWRTANWSEINFSPVADIPNFPTIPEFPSMPAMIAMPSTSGINYSPNITSSKTVTLTANSTTMYRKISLGWNDSLTFALNGNATVIVDEYSCTGQLKISGQGSLLLVIKSSITSSRTLMNQNGDPNALTVLVTGSEVKFGSGGDGSSFCGKLYAPTATIETSNPTNINGDIIAGGTSLTFGSLSHNGNLYALNANAVIKYEGNRSLVSGTITNIFSNGKTLEIMPTNIVGNIYLNNEAAVFVLGSSSTYKGNLWTKGTAITLSGSSKFDGNIIASNPTAVVRVNSGAENKGSILSNGPTVEFRGGSTGLNGLVFAPNADFFIFDGARLTGSITAYTFTSNGAAIITYQEVSLNDLPVEIQPSEGISASSTNWRVYGTWIKE